MTKPLWTMASDAARWFTWQYSLPKVAWASLKTGAGFVRVGSQGKPTAMVFSISEDYARVWLYFARKFLERDQWHFLIVDSSGELDPAKLEDCQTLRFLNIYHGRKIDIFLRKVLQSDTVFLCDDDQYVVADMTEHLSTLEKPTTPVVSLRPRSWWRFRIDGREYLPMGSYALLFKRGVFLQNNLRFQSPKGLKSSHKVFPPDVKTQLSYDTADYANEQLLLAGYHVETIQKNSPLLGFSGMSGPRILLKKYGKAVVRDALLAASHYKEGSINGTVLRALYAIVIFEQLYRRIFHEEPRSLSGFSTDELRAILRQNSHIDEHERMLVSEHFERQHEILQRISRKI